MAGGAMPLVVLLLATIPLLFFTIKRSAQRRGGGGGGEGRLPPGPWALPVIGHLHHLAGDLPHRALSALARRHGALMLLRLGEVQAVVASSPDAAREIMRTHDAAFASRPLSPMQQLAYGRDAEGVIFAPYGDGWRHLRKICTAELLSARRVQSFRPVREAELGRLLRSVAEATSSSSSASLVNLTELISAFVADSTVRAIIGSRFEHRDAYLRMLQDGLKIVPGMTLPDLFPSSRLALFLSRVPGRIEHHRQGMQRFIDAIIVEHQEKRAAAAANDDDDEDEDLLDVLLKLQKEMGSHHPLTTANIKTVMLDMFGAGSESSATVLQWTMAELMRNPRVMQKAQDEVRRALAGHDKVTEPNLTNLPYLRLVIKETLRLHPPAPLLLPRKCGSTCKILGFDVPEGVMVIVNAWAIGRDPTYWDKPEEFVPERFEHNGRNFKGMDFEFIPFGAGRRICPGITFGMAHVELVLSALLYHFDWELPQGMAAKDLDMTEDFGVTTQRRSNLLVRPIHRVSVLVE
uniref:Cytochrome P450 n=2 Tax=Oryza glaberrima TaxID=4538 RepID=I1NY01_ORYGL